MDKSVYPTRYAILRHHEQTGIKEIVDGKVYDTYAEVRQAYKVELCDTDDGLGTSYQGWWYTIIDFELPDFV